MRYSLLCSFSLLFFFACQKENVEVPDTGRKIVINALITTDSLLNARISNSSYIKDLFMYEVYYTDFKGANVSFFRNSIFVDSLHYSFQDDYNGHPVYPVSNYKSDNTYPDPGDEYEIKVNKSGFPEAVATTTIPTLVQIEKVDTSRIDVNGYNFIMNCKIEFTDPAVEKNYYLFNIIRIRMFPWWREYLAFDCQDPIVEEELTSSRGSGSSINVVYDKNGFAFSDKLIDGKKYSLNVLFKGSYYYYYNNAPPKTSYIYYFRLISITEDYFKFIKTLNLFNATYMNPLAEPVMVYSNVSGGYGIFAGAAVSTDSIIIYDQQ